MTRKERPGLGIALMVGAVTCFACLDATAKWVSQTLPTLQTVGLRYVSAFVFITLLCRPWARPRVVRSRSPGLQVVRSMTLVLSTVCSFVSLHYLPLGQVAAIQFAAPLVIAALAGPLLGEWPGPHRWAAVLVGFAGVVVVTRPGFDMHWAVLVALCTALGSAAYALTTRKLAGRDRALTTLFWSGFVGLLVVAPVLPFVWATPTPTIWALMVLMGVLATLGHYLLILANDRASASVLAPFTYTQLVGATVLGYLVFNESPDRWTLTGGAIVAASGLYLLLRERSTRPAAPATDTTSRAPPAA